MKDTRTLTSYCVCVRERVCARACETERERFAKVPRNLALSPKARTCSILIRFQVHHIISTSVSTAHAPSMTSALRSVFSLLLKILERWTFYSDVIGKRLYFSTGSEGSSVTRVGPDIDVYCSQFVRKCPFVWNASRNFYLSGESLWLTVNQLLREKSVTASEALYFPSLCASPPSGQLCVMSGCPVTTSDHKSSPAPPCNIFSHLQRKHFQYKPTTDFYFIFIVV